MPNDVRDQGDDIARGVVTECPECGEFDVRHGTCGNCDWYEGCEDYNPFDYTDDPYEYDDGSA